MSETSNIFEKLTIVMTVLWIVVMIQRNEMSCPVAAGVQYNFRDLFCLLHKSIIKVTNQVLRGISFEFNSTDCKHYLHILRF